MICLQSYEKKRIFANNMTKNIIGFDVKRAVHNGTGLGSYGRTMVNAWHKDMLTWRIWPMPSVI